MLAKCVLVLALAAACAAQMVAVAYVTPVNTSMFTWSGWVKFEQQMTGGVWVTAQVSTNAPDGTYGMHVHSWGDATSPAGNFLGSHYNPFGAPHGCPAGIRHNGDLGNLTVATGMGTYNALVDNITLSGDYSIVGRGLVIHNVSDDCTPTWVGAKGAQGVIGIANVAGNGAVVGSGLTTVSTAIAALWPTGAATNSAGTLNGRVVFYSTQTGSTRMSMTLGGLMPWKQYSWHVHQFGDMNNTAGFGLGAGGHYNPSNAGFHGFMDMDATVHHAGDLGNFTTDVNGNANVEIDIAALALNGASSIVGRMIIIHNQTDVGPANGGSTANGNAGARIGYGVIGISSMSVNPGAYPVEVGTAWVYSTPDQVLAGNIYNGSVTWTRVGANIVIAGMIGGFEANSVHAIHIHQYGDISTNTSTGTHYNPLNVAHGFPDQMPHHLGDMGNFTADANGLITISMTVGYMDLGGWSSIIGRAVVVHSMADNGAAAQTTGNSGNRWAAGVIGIANVPGNRAFAQPTIGVLNGGMYYMDNDLVLTAAFVNTTNAIYGYILGTAWLYYDNATYMGGTSMDVNATVWGPGLVPNLMHGWHIHAWGDITDRSANTAGAHYNPYLANHDLPTVLPRHQGDLGNIMVDSYNMFVTGPVSAGPYNVAPLTYVNNVIGRTFMIHNTTDIGSTGLPTGTGGAGSRVACGVIGIAAGIHNPYVAPPPPPPTPPPPMDTSTGTAPPPPPMDSTTASGASVLSASLAIIVALVAALLL